MTDHEQDGWQPIETAPKDGRRVLVYNAYFGVYSSQFVVERNVDNSIKWEGFPLGLSSVGFGRWYCTASQWKPLPPRPLNDSADPWR